MKPLFPTYIIKLKAKRTMQGKLFKAFLVSVIPSLIVAAVAVTLFFLIPGARESLELALSGNFESAEARMEYISRLSDNHVLAIELLSVLFAFLSLGTSRACLDMVRGKEVGVRDVFRYYNKWYIAAICPAFSLALSYAGGSLISALSSAGAAVAGMASLVINILFYYISFKLVFVDYTLAETDCNDFTGAVKASWNMVGWNSVVNIFLLSLSFMGWFLLSAVTMGLAFVFVLPYYNLSLAVLYDANREYQKRLEE